jgi:L-fucose mutarotase
MLKGIDHRLNADVLWVLRAMGHGDTVVIADANFPGTAIAQDTSYGDLLRMDTPTSAGAVAAVLSLMPLDTFDDDFAMRMQIVGDATTLPAAQAEAQAAIDAAEGRSRPMVGLDRFAFYEAARGAFAVIQTAERRFYGCFILRKGVIPPDG